MELSYVHYQELPSEPHLTSLLALLAGLFSYQSSSEVQSELTYQYSRTGLQAILALADGQVIGCKLGYERKPGHNYSWLGGVHPDFRSHGIATELMRWQHGWCQQQGYQTIRTQTYNQWRSMLILNLRHGFDITGTLQGKHGLTIVLEKRL
ncbi:GNAT family N-acetyltransferase [Spirosoma fluviale]|uniref:Acetyltransferase (GNAT) family protein n=1 Tax=Spirosoma fluviale TaxID=1597977 RepID=A0A286F9B7_9BACT|nr:GNAT family N-acetyltransferase [Spirosoma fluviale]SOD79783.1 Acetyltransferase (GNAT) family protein [Spirosoma fluviale]